MQFLNKQIAALSKKKKKSLVRRQISCGIFQEVDNLDLSSKEKMAPQQKPFPSQVLDED